MTSDKDHSSTSDEDDATSMDSEIGENDKDSEREVTSSGSTATASSSTPSPERSAHVLYDEWYKSLSKDDLEAIKRSQEPEEFNPILYNDEEHGDLKYRTMLVRGKTIACYKAMKEQEENVEVDNRELAVRARARCYYPGNYGGRILPADFRIFSPEKIELSPTSSEERTVELGYFYADLPPGDGKSSPGIPTFSPPPSTTITSSSPRGTTATRTTTTTTTTSSSLSSMISGQPIAASSPHLTSGRTPVIPDFKTPERKRRDNEDDDSDFIIEEQLSPAMEMMNVTRRQRVADPEKMVSRSSHYFEPNEEDAGSAKPLMRVSTPTSRFGSPPPSPTNNVTMRKKGVNPETEKSMVHFIKLGRVDKKRASPSTSNHSVKSMSLESVIQTVSPIVRHRVIHQSFVSPVRSPNARPGDADAVNLSPPLSSHQSSPSTACTKSTRRVVLLIREDIRSKIVDIIDDFLLTFNAVVCSIYRPDVTHVISDVKTLSKVKIEFLQAIGYKKFLVTVDWMTLSIMLDRLVEEIDHEVSFDVVGDVPRFIVRTAMLENWKLLVGYAFLPAEPFRGFQKKALKDLLVRNGGVVVSNPEELSKCKDLTRVCLVGSRDFFRHADNTQRLLHRLRKCNCIRVRYGWILECFATYQILPMTPYLFEMTPEEALAAGLAPEEAPAH